MPVDLILSLLAQGATLGFSATASPGPFQTYLISETLARGWKHSIPAVLSPFISDGPAIILVVLILGQVSVWVLRGLQLVGGLFVLYLAWGMFQQLRQNKPIKLEAEDTPKAQNVILRGAGINFFSPGMWIFWSTVNGPIVIKAWQQSPAAAIAFMVGFYAVLIGGFVAWVAVFNQARRLDERVIRGLLAVSVVIMVIFGVGLLKSGVFG